jgi:L-alanine-DL-glutamate epimerase-like enolase superfamily enzyme
MKRRQFIELASSSAVLFLPGAFSTKAYRSGFDYLSDGYPELGKHIIEKGELKELNYSWPRFVGKNGRRDDHGQKQKNTILKLYTDQGAMGWGLSNKKEAELLLPSLINKKVSDVIIPGKGITEGLNRSVDFALHDLMGVILNKPVYQLLGDKGRKETLVYSGMIYLDELSPGKEIKGTDAILENCEWDFNYGYRQLKVKIGRSGKWYPHNEGLKKDIEVVKLIYNSFKNRNIELLVDSNDMYSLEDTIDFLKGIGNIPLFWVEEPFREEVANGRKLKEWMNKNGFKKTYYCDGEAGPDYQVCMQLGKEGIMDVFLDDIYSLGFTKWINLMADLKKINMLASPHAWGDRLKTNYISHLSAGLDNMATIEGVTCLSDEIDYGNYPIINGKLIVSEAPGFGMKLLV